MRGAARRAPERPQRPLTEDQIARIEEVRERIRATRTKSKKVSSFKKPKSPPTETKDGEAIFMKEPMLCYNCGGFFGAYGTPEEIEEGIYCCETCKTLPREGAQKIDEHLMQQEMLEAEQGQHLLPCEKCHQLRGDCVCHRCGTCNLIVEQCICSPENRTWPAAATRPPRIRAPRDAGWIAPILPGQPVNPFAEAATTVTTAGVTYHTDLNQARGPRTGGRIAAPHPAGEEICVRCQMRLLTHCSCPGGTTWRTCTCNQCRQTRVRNRYRNAIMDYGFNAATTAVVFCYRCERFGDPLTTAHACGCAQGPLTTRPDPEELDEEGGYDNDFAEEEYDPEDGGADTF